MRGVYFKKNFPKGHILTTDDVYLAVPLQEGQISPREFMEGETLLRACKKDEPMVIQDIDSVYKEDSDTHARLSKRGLRCVK